MAERDGRRDGSIDPITFEVIRNALVAATDEMVLRCAGAPTRRTSRRARTSRARSSTPSCASVAQGFAQPVHLGSMVEQVPHAVRTTAPRTSGPGDVIITNDPYPERRPPERRQPDLARLREGELLGYVANLAHHVDVGGGAPASDRRLPRGVPGGRDHPAGQGRRGGTDRRRRLRADPRADPLQARDRRRLPRPDRREQHRRAAARRRSSSGTATTTIVATMDELLDYTERRTRAEIAALPHGVCEAEGSVDTDGYTDEPVRLRARVEIGADGVRFDLAGLRPAAARARQLDLRADVLGLRVRAEVPDRPGPAGQRRLLPARPARRAGGQRHELHLAEPGRRRLGDADPPRRRDLPRPPARPARARCRRGRRR